MIIKIKSLIFKIIKLLGLRYPYYKLIILIKQILNIKSAGFKKGINFYSKIIKPGDLIFDIGANIGNKTELFLALGAEVICFEPNPHLADMLRFRFGNRIKVLNYGVGDINGELEFYIGSINLISTFSKSFYDLNKKGYSNKRIVPVKNNRSYY